MVASERLDSSLPRHATRPDADAPVGSLHQAIELDSKFVKGYARKGAALHGMRRYEDAVFA